jgi:hypothetical protein
VPNESLPLDRSQPDHNQTERRQLDLAPEHDAKASGHFGGAQENRKPVSGILEIIPAAGDENHADHKAQQQKSEVR